MNEELSNDVEKFIEKLEGHIKSAEEKKKYSLERFDVLIISLSSGGLAMTLSIFNEYKDLPIYSIKTSWIFFSLGLIINLTSQGTGFFANKFDIDCTRKIIEEEKGNIGEGTHKKLDIKSKSCTKWTGILNVASFISLILAILSVVIFITLKI